MNIMTAARSRYVDMLVFALSPNAVFWGPLGEINMGTNQEIRRRYS